MKLEGNYKFEASLTQVWEAFTNPRYLEKAIPGCETLKECEPNKYDAVLKVGIPGVKGTYTSKFEVVDAVPPNQCRLVGEGSGSPGFVKSSTLINLKSEGDATVINYEGDLQIGGLISGVGQRMLSGIAKMMLNQFLKAMSKELKNAQKAQSAASVQ